MTPEPQSLSLVERILERLRRRKIELLRSSDLYRLPCRRIPRLPLGSVLHLELAEARDRRLASRRCSCGDGRKNRLDALQSQQQLSMQALPVANSQPEHILQLFR